VPSRASYYPCNSTWGKQARRPASEEDANDLSPFYIDCLRFQIALERVHVTTLVEVTVQRVGIEIAVRALPYAPGEVNVER
jgi:hypothetical protein